MALYITAFHIIQWAGNVAQYAYYFSEHTNLSENQLASRTPWSDITHVIGQFLTLASNGFLCPKKVDAKRKYARKHYARVLTFAAPR